MPTLAQKSERAQDSLLAYSRAHLTLAALTERAVDSVAARVLTPSEALEGLAEFVGQYRHRLAELDGRAGQ